MDFSLCANARPLRHDVCPIAPGRRASVVPLVSAAAPGVRPIQVLIIDGCSNHDWKRTTQLVCGILQATNLFELTVETAPANVEDPAYAAWCPDFSRYQVVIQNYNNLQGGAPWPAPARDAFVQFVQNGGGVFILHSANNSFPDWDEYNHIIGLGWRKKEYGTAIEIGPDENLIRIPPGQGGNTTHNPRQDRLIHLLGDDPIHAGMPRTWTSAEELRNAPARIRRQKANR
jgi:hypothetical protein